MWERLAKAGIAYTRPQGAPPRDRPGKRRFLDELAHDALRGMPLEGKRVLAQRGTYVFSTMHPVTLRMYETWTGTGWRLKTPYFDDRAVPIADPTWEFGEVRVKAPTLEYGHRIGDLVNACALVGLLVDGLWEWSPSYEGGEPGSEDELERQLPALIQIRARKTAPGATGSRTRTDAPAPPPLTPRREYSPPSQPRTRAR